MGFRDQKALCGAQKSLCELWLAVLSSSSFLLLCQSKVRLLVRAIVIKLKFKLPFL